MNQVHFIANKCISSKERSQNVAFKIAKTKVDNSISEIKVAIAELEADDIAVTQANVIRKLKGKKCKRTIINHWKNLFPSPQAETLFVERDPAQQKPLHQWSNEELGIPSLEQERKINAGKSDAVLMYYLLAMREMRMKQLQTNQGYFCVGG